MTKISGSLKVSFPTHPYFNFFLSGGHEMQNEFEPRSSLELCWSGSGFCRSKKQTILVVLAFS